MSLLLNILLLAAQASDSATAFVGVATFRTDRPGWDRNQTVVVRGGTIVWVGPAPQARLDPATRRIAGQGRYLLPGFADMHVHLDREGDLITYVANGITTVRNMWGEPRHLEWRRRIAAGELIGPRIVTSGPILDGNPPSVPQMTVLIDPARARAEIDRQAALGYDFIKVYNSLPKAVFDTVLLAAAAHKLPVAGHVPFEAGLRGVLASRQASIEHLRGYIAELVPATAPVQPGASLKSRSVAWNYVDSTRMTALAQATATAGIWNCPTLMVTAELLAPPDRWEELARRPILQYLGPGAAGDRAAIPYLRDFSPDDYREAGRGVGAQRRMVRELDRAGAGLLLGTDSYLQGFALEAELAEFEAAGIDRGRILTIATANAATFLGESDRWGRIAVGQRADLQLLDADPVADLAALDRRAGVMVAGRWLSKADLAERLERLRARP